MEATTTTRVCVMNSTALKFRQKYLAFGKSVLLRSPMNSKLISPHSIRAQQFTSTIAETDHKNALKIKEWEKGKFQDELAATQGIKIRRRPPTGPPLNYVGPFEFRLENEEDNTPLDILEEIMWNKDKEVSLLKERKPLATLKKELENAPPVRDFLGALRKSHLRTGLPALIAELKKASPSRGLLRKDFDPDVDGNCLQENGCLPPSKDLRSSPDIAR